MPHEHLRMALSRITFCDDGTFLGDSIGDIALEGFEGTFILSYDEKIRLKHNDGRVGTVQYISSKNQIIYYTIDGNKRPINVYYKK